MIPIRDLNPTRTRPWLTISIIAANVVVFLIEPLRASDLAQQRFFLCHAVVPIEVTHGGPIGFPACPDKSVWLSVFKSMFLHGSILHIAGNMLFLWVFGNNIEDTLGRLRFLVLYLAAGIAAVYAQSYISPNSIQPLIGASGAIAGVLGAYLLLFPRARVITLVIFVFFITTVEMPAVVVLGLWFLFQFIGPALGDVSGGAGGVAYMAHVGGFVAGMVLLFVLGGYRRPPPPPRERAVYYEYD